MKNNFFDETSNEKNNLAQLFFGYAHYCHEYIWLLKQKLFYKMCLQLQYLNENQLEQAIKTQKRAFSAGKQIHIGEILLQMYLLDEEKIYTLCGILGEEILYEPHTNQCYKALFSTEEERIRHGKNLQPKKANEVSREQLLRFLRIDYSWPRQVPEKTKESHDLFVFLNTETHSLMKVDELDNEFHNVIATFKHWIATPVMANETHINSLSQEQAQTEKQKNLELVKQVFLGYNKNLRELLWLLQQKMFEDLAIKYYKITSQQVKDALKVQHRAFQQNKQLQLPEVMLHMYLLNELQVYDILKGLGNYVLCGDEKFYLTSSPNISSKAVNCNSLEQVKLKYETVMQSLRIDLAKPVIIPDGLVDHSTFLFFRKRGKYIPDFDLKEQELAVAISSIYTHLDIDTPQHIIENMSQKEQFNETHRASETLTPEKNENHDEMISAVPLTGDSLIEMEAAQGNTTDSLKHRLRQTLSLPAIPISEEDKQQISGNKKATAILQKFSKTITMSLQKRARKKAQTQEQTSAPKQAKLASRKPVVNYQQYSETIYGYVMANIDAKEKGLPTQREIVGKRTNVFEQIAKRIDRPQEAKAKKAEVDIYDEILTEIETDQSSGNKEFAIKRAQEKEKIKNEFEEENFEEYYVDFKSGDQMPTHLDEIGDSGEFTPLEPDIMDISTEVDSFLQSFDDIDENTDIEQLYDKFSRDTGSDYDPLLEMEEIEQPQPQTQPQQLQKAEQNPGTRNNPQLRRTISISQPKLHSAIPTALEYVEGYKEKESSLLAKLTVPLLLVLFTSGLVYLFVQPYLKATTDEKQNDVSQNKKNNKKIPNKTRSIDDDFTDEDFEQTKIDEPKEKIVKNNPPQKQNPVVKKNPTKNNTAQKTPRLRDYLYGNEGNPSKVSKALRSMSQRGILDKEDVDYIKELYNQHQDKKVKKLCIWAMGSISSSEAREWLESVLIASQQAENRKAALNALEKTGDARAQGSILDTFRREQDKSVLEAAAYSLAKIAPENYDVQQSMIAKFYEVNSESIKQKIINALSGMNIDSQSEFFVRIAIDSQYSTGIRLEALDALISNTAGNSSNYVSEISILSASQDEELKAKVQEALEYLSDG
ncbi:HEAT repeat domain-containing protein [Candidatus Uabimicrobium sp. HlEnr_7]|uniref:HEAT repeat domain-containing protein n=1 Tax=Candidatus Uabimicrobium helgolandensis TaxID=3095367 RepID=UPI003557792E